MKTRPWMVNHRLQEIRELAREFNNQPDANNKSEINFRNEEQKLDLLFVPDNQIDEMSVYADRLFKKRFWKDLPSFFRRKIIDLKIENDWTETQLKILLISGFVRADKKTRLVRIYNDKWSYLYGCLQIFLLFLLYVSGVYSITASGHSGIKVLAGVCATIAFGVLSIWIIYITLIAPYNIIRFSVVSNGNKSFYITR